MPIINQQTIKEGFKQMQAAVYESYGPPEVVHLCEVPIPVCKDDHVLVQIGASSVNSADVRTRALDVPGPLKVILRLVMGWKRPKQPILGTVFSGKVIAVGSLATDFQVGDRLFGCTPGLGFGCHAEYVAVPIKAAMAKCPVKASDAESVSLVFGGTTALFFLNKASSKIGSTLLVYGASGAVGCMAVQIAKRMGFRVTACASDMHREAVLSLGPDAFLSYTNKELADCSTRFDVVFDAVGKMPAAERRRLLSDKGIFLTVGGSSVAKETKDQLEQLRQWFEEGTLKPIIDSTYRLQDITAAHARVDTKHKVGSVVVLMDDRS